MTRTDSLVVGTLVVMLALLAGLVGVPALQPRRHDHRPAERRARPSTPPLDRTAKASSDTRSRSARSRRGPRPTATSSRSSSPGSSATARRERSCPTSPSAGRSTRPASSGPSSCATTRVWHDGEPVTAEDVAFTIRVLQDPAYHGPAAGSWNEVTVQATAPRTVTFTLKTPLGGFLQAATQPIAPAHLLAGVPIADLPDHPFGRQPDRLRSVRHRQPHRRRGRAHPGRQPARRRRPRAPGPPPRSTDSLATAPPLGRPTRPVPYLAGIEFRFYDDPTALADAYRAGSLDAASGLSPALGRGARGDRREPRSALSGRDADGRPAQPATGPPGVRDAGRPDGAARGHRPTSDHRPTRSRWPPAQATGPDPAGVAAVRSGRRPARRPTTSTAAKTALKAAGWTQAADGWHLPGAKTADRHRAPEPGRGIEPGACTPRPTAVARDWTALGLTVTHARPAARASS